MALDTTQALCELNKHPNTVFIVITVEGSFFSSGADVKGERDDEKVFDYISSVRLTGIQ